MRNRAGSGWTKVGGSLMQIDSGPFGVVYGVSKLHRIWYRTGITWYNPKGSGWVRVQGSLKYISVGQFGAWGVTNQNAIYFRYGITRSKPQGKRTAVLAVFILETDNPSR